MPYYNYSAFIPGKPFLTFTQSFIWLCYVEANMVLVNILPDVLVEDYKNTENKRSVFAVSQKRARAMLSMLLVVCLLVGGLPAEVALFGERTAAAATTGTVVNGYKNPVTYNPVGLYGFDAAGPGNVVPLNFLDAVLSPLAPGGPLADVSAKEEKGWLSSENYILNSFGRLDREQSTVNYKNNFKATEDVRFNGVIDNEDHEGAYDAAYDFSSMRNTDYGNIANMLAKGDLSFMFAGHVFTKEDWDNYVLFKISRNSYAILLSLGEAGFYYAPPGWHNVNYLTSGRLALATATSWVNNDNLSLVFKGYGDEGANVASWLKDGVLLGKDSQGPRISEVTVRDADGNTLQSVTDDYIGKTVYFHVTFDEPVKFVDEFANDTDKLGGLSLTAQTIGRGTTAMPAQAHFLRFTPGVNESRPTMVFEYRIVDPQTNPARGDYYRFASVTVSKGEGDETGENTDFYDYLTDIAGNPFGYSDGEQPTEVSVNITHQPLVDLTPFKVESVSLEPLTGVNNPFLAMGDMLSVTLNLNKPFGREVFTDYTYFLNDNFQQHTPAITLNVLDKDNNSVVIAPPNDYYTPLMRGRVNAATGEVTPSIWSFRLADDRAALEVDLNAVRDLRPDDWQMRYTVDRITYRFQLLPGMRTSDGGPVRVTSVSIPSGAMDDTGQVLTFDATVPHIGDYRMDFAEPEVSVTLNEEAASGVIKIQADIDDQSLSGSDAVFTISTDLDAAADAKLQYQVSIDGDYDSGWKAAEAKSFTVGAPIIGGHAYVFLKFPEASQANSVQAQVKVSDEAGNTGRGSCELTEPSWGGYDRLAPTIELIRVSGKEDDSARVAIYDLNSSTYQYLWRDTVSPPTEGDWTVATKAVASGVRVTESIACDHVMDENDIYKKTLWIRAEDEAGNIALKSLDFVFDKTFGEIFIDVVSHSPDELLTAEHGYPSATVTLKNVKSYFYLWVEAAPDGFNAVDVWGSANYSTHFPAWAEMNAWAEMVADDDPGEPGHTNQATLTASLSADTKVVRHAVPYDKHKKWEYLFSPVGSVHPDNLKTDALIAASELSQPVWLVIGVIDGNDDPYFQAVEFNTLKAAPEISFRQYRLSSNDRLGELQHTERTNWSDSTLFWPHERFSDRRPAMSVTSLNDFAQAEFYLNGNRLLGLSQLELGGQTKIHLEKIVYTADLIEGAPDDYNDKTLVFANEVVASRESVQSWPVTSAALQQTDRGYNEFYVNGYPGFPEDGELYRFVAQLDLAAIDQVAYELHAEGADAKVWNVRYEFWAETAYLPQFGLEPTKTLISSFIFHNDVPSGQPTALYSGEYVNYWSEATLLRPVNAPATIANLVAEGGVITDRTSAPDVLTFANSEQVLPWFGVNLPLDAHRILDAALGFVKTEPDGSYIGSSVYVRYGTSVDLAVTDGGAVVLGDTAKRTRIDFYEGRIGYPTGAEFPSTIDGFDQSGVTQTVYYQFVDLYNQSASVIYRVDLRRDDQPPVVNLRVSTTDPTTGQVIVTIDGVHDGHIDGEAFVVDTPTTAIALNITAKYNDGTEVPTDNGVFVFERNGSITVTATDAAGNVSNTLSVNGKLQATDTYQIMNIDREPPLISNGSASASDGKFILNATVDDTTTASYLQFDRDYSQHLTGIAYSEADQLPRFALTAVPGRESSQWAADGNISVTAYIKSGVPLGQVTLIAVDSAGNEVQHSFSLNADGVVPTVVNTDKTYVYGAPLTFSVPVKLIDLASEQPGFALSHTRLPVYADGSFTVSYQDQFGRSYNETVTADIFGVAYRHSLVLSPSSPTKGNVTVQINTDGYPVTVAGGSTANYREILVSENGTVSYTLHPDDPGLGARSFTIPVTNIDQQVPTPHVGRFVGGTETIDAAGKSTVSGPVTVEILGFDEAGVTMKGGAPTWHTFSQPGNHTFEFVDAAGNAGTYVADETETIFTAPIDNTIAGYRLTYTAAADGGSARMLGVYNSGDAPVSLPLVNRDIAVKIEVQNAAGQVIPATMELIETESYVQYFTAQSSVVFSANGTTTVRLKADNSVEVPVTIAAIDKVAPVGSVEYVMLTAAETAPDGGMLSKGAVKAYLVCDEPDLVEVLGSGVQHDTDGYFIYFDRNAQGVFYLLDKAGNVGSVPVGVYSVDLHSPEVTSESWYSSIAAAPDALDYTTGHSQADILSTPTNSAIRLFFVFDEAIKRVDVTAYNREGGTPYANTADYIVSTWSGNTATVEFLQNCQANIVVWDLRDNPTHLWRPEDGPITVIDREAPQITSLSQTLQENQVRITYNFDEPVTSAKVETELATSHTLVFDQNGVYPLVFSDAVGNTVSTVAVITEVDDTSPKIYYGLQIVPVDGGTTPVVVGEDGVGPYATNGHVEIAIAAQDASSIAAITVVDQNGRNAALAQHAPTISGKVVSYTTAVTVRQNGIYTITATDEHGNNNAVYVRIDFIDRTPPTIVLASAKALEVPYGIGAAELQQRLLQGVTAADSFFGNVTPSVDIGLVDRDTMGEYSVTYTASDGLGNTAARTRVVRVVSPDRRVFRVNGETVLANETHPAASGQIQVDVSNLFSGEVVTLYYSQGFRKPAEMKYADRFDGEFTATTKGYYTVLARSAERGSQLIYIYVY